MSTPDPTFVYRLFNADRQLLYVGVTCEKNLNVRMSQHRRARPWWDSVDPMRTTIDKYPDRRSAEWAEREAIVFERPTHNRADRAIRGATVNAALDVTGYAGEYHDRACALLRRAHASGIRIPAAESRKVLSRARAAGNPIVDLVPDPA